jgi:hypothetical protein
MIICIPPLPLPKAQQPLVGQDLLIIQVSRLYSIIHTTLIPREETSTWQQNNTQQETDIHAPGGIRTRYPRAREATYHAFDAPPLGSAFICMFKSKYR